MHHIVSDGWSTGVLIRELAIIYQAVLAGRASPLPDLPIQYADFAHWQRQWLRGEILETQLDYWKRQLSGAAQLELSTDHPRRPMQTFRGAHQALVLPGAVTEGLKALSRNEGATIFMSLMAAFKVLLHRYTGQDDIIVGTPIANRNRLEIEGLIGFFVNTLVLRTDLSGNPSFRELLRRVREVCLGAYVHQDLPFERLVEEMHLERDLSRNPLFQVMFVLRNASGQTIELPGLTLSALEVDSGTTHFDLILHMTETGEGLSGTLVYNTDLFEPATIARMLDHFQVLLKALVADPDKLVSDLPLLTEVESKQLLTGWNNSQCDYPPPTCVHQLFAAQAEQTPDAIAVVFEGQQLSYRELNRRSNQLAQHLRTLGVGPEVTVAICLEHSLEMIIGLLGVLKAGGVYVPLDPLCPKERSSFMLEDAKVAVLLTAERLLLRLPKHAAQVICLDSGWEAIALESAENPINWTGPENLAYLIYTSGSTGRPKGVLISHGSIAQHCLDIKSYYELGRQDRVLQSGSLSFDLSLEQILPTLIAGASLVMWRIDLENTTDFYRKVSEFELTVLNLSTAYWQELARDWAHLPALGSTGRLRLFVVGGDTLLPDALLRWQSTAFSSIRLVNAYGPTEATITATAFEVSPGLGEIARSERIPIGRPLANRMTYILDKYGSPVPVGIPGELHIGGAGLARGYLNQPDLTADRFVPDPFSQQAWSANVQERRPGPLPLRW